MIYGNEFHEIIISTNKFNNFPFYNFKKELKIKF